MNSTMKAVKISERIYWVGAVDWGLREFHGYATQRGSTYNAFLIMADKITLIDTVKKHFMDEMLSRIASVTDPRNIDYIVSNHTEMDHSGGLPEAIRAIEPEKVFASIMGEKALKAHFHWDQPVQIVKDQETLSLGNANLTFLETRLLHWPDSMFTYLQEEATLFTQDAFGCHLASNRLFSDEVDPAILEYEMAKYYANILLPYARLINKLLAKIAAMNLAVSMILPDHGPLWKNDVKRPLDWYAKWSAQKPEKKALIIYDTMWQSTALMAKVIAEEIAEKDIIVKTLPIKGTHRSDVATQVLNAGALLAGSPTINSNIYPSVIDTLTYLRGLRPQNLVGAAFGSYGWSGQAVKQINEILEEMRVELVHKGLRVNYVPDDAALEECRVLGQLIGNRLSALSEGE